MANPTKNDKFNASTGKPDPAGVPYSSLNAMARSTADSYISGTASDLQQPAVQASGGVVQISDGDPTSSMDFESMIAAGDAAVGADDKSFPVAISALSPQTLAAIPEKLRSPNPTGVTVPMDTASKEGIYGLNDQGMIDKVAGLAKNNPILYDTVYKTAIAYAAAMQKSGDMVTVDQLLDRWSKGGLPENLKKLVNGGSGGSGGPFSSVNRVVSLSDPGTASQLINRALSGYLGRQATDIESKAFLQALNVQEKQNPTITTTKGYSDGSGNSSSSQTVTGGFNKDAFAERFAKSQQGYAEYQAATTYLDAFIGALESDSRVI